MASAKIARMRSLAVPIPFANTQIAAARKSRDEPKALLRFRFRMSYSSLEAAR
jgi:hypothetical protein